MTTNDTTTTPAPRPTPTRLQKMLRACSPTKVQFSDRKRVPGLRLEWRRSEAWQPRSPEASLRWTAASVGAFLFLLCGLVFGGFVGLIANAKGLGLAAKFVLLPILGIGLFCWLSPGVGFLRASVEGTIVPAAATPKPAKTENAARRLVSDARQAARDGIREYPGEVRKAWKRVKDDWRALRAGKRGDDDAAAKKETTEKKE